MRLSLTVDEIVGAMVDRYFQPILTELNRMSQELNDLQTAVGALNNAVTAADANAAALKEKLTAATVANASLTAQVTDLNTQLAAAQAAVPDPTLIPGVVAATQSVVGATEALNKSTADNTP